MNRDISKFTKEIYDLLVIGGGINGAAIAHMAAINGLKVALLEKGDFASGTSSKSTKLLHGGLRYLENFEFDLVHEALKERTIQLQSSPHLTNSLGFIIPVYKSDARPFWMMKLGVWLYDFLSGKYLVNKHCSLTSQEVLQFIPSLKKENLLGGVMYYDAQMNDARLCLENVLSAREKGADVINYVEVKSFLKDREKATGVIAQDLLGMASFEVKARRIVCAAGPWTNLFLNKDQAQDLSKVRTTKGVHLVYRDKISEHAILIPTQNSRRIFFIIPWMNHSLIGTTDTDFEGSPDRVEVEERDVDYLLKEAQRIFSGVVFKKDNIISTFAGLRPLVYQKGHPSQLSRKHVIEESSAGIIYVMGGKYTTYRKIAEETLRHLIKDPLVYTQKSFPVYGSGKILEDPLEVAQRCHLEPRVVRYLMDYYGIRYQDVLTLIIENPKLKDPICTCSPVVAAQVVYAVQTEMACRVDDIVLRRLTLGFEDCSIGRCRQEIKEYLALYEQKSH